MTLGHRRVARLDHLLAEHPRELLRRDLPVAVHQADEGLLVAGLQHDRLDDGVLVDAQRFGAGARSPLLDVLVEAWFERHLRGA